MGPTYTTITVIRKPAIRKKMPAVLRCGIASLKKQTTRQKIQVDMIYAMKTCHCFASNEGCVKAYIWTMVLAVNSIQ